MIRAAYAFQELGLGRAVLVGREATVRANMAQVGVPEGAKLNIVNARLSEHNETYAEYLYKRLQRFGFLQRDVQRLVNQDRNVFAACMVAHGHADGVLDLLRAQPEAFGEEFRCRGLQAVAHQFDPPGAKPRRNIGGGKCHREHRKPGFACRNPRHDST